MSNTCLIISGGEFHPFERRHPFDCVIACDRGYAHALRLGISPDIIIGDFDSYNGELPIDKEIIRLPVNKDDTDTDFAVKLALSRGFDNIVITCAMGGRFDHEFANIQTLCNIAKHGAAATMVSSTTILHAICSNSIILPKRNGWSFSVFSISDECTNVSISGAEYNVTNETFFNTYPMGESNNWAEGSAFISCESGILLIVEVKR